MFPPVFGPRYDVQYTLSTSLNCQELRQFASMLATMWCTGCYHGPWPQYGCCQIPLLWQSEEAAFTLWFLLLVACKSAWNLKDWRILCQLSPFDMAAQCNGPCTVLLNQLLHIRHGVTQFTVTVADSAAGAISSCKEQRCDSKRAWCCQVICRLVKMRSYWRIVHAACPYF